MFEVVNMAWVAVTAGLEDGWPDHERGRIP